MLYKILYNYRTQQLTDQRIPCPIPFISLTQKNYIIPLPSNSRLGPGGGGGVEESPPQQSPLQKLRPKPPNIHKPLQTMLRNTCTTSYHWALNTDPLYRPQMYSTFTVQGMYSSVYGHTQIVVVLSVCHIYCTHQQVHAGKCIRVLYVSLEWHVGFLWLK